MTTPDLPFSEPIPVRTVPTPGKKYPFFIVAYYPAGGWWKIHPTLYESADCEQISAAVAELLSKGWAYVTIYKLP